jgi:hypothetical protein
MFVPFHYGYWDNPGHMRAANELTIFEWDAVSKQPHFKYAAVRARRIDAPATSAPIGAAAQDTMTDVSTDAQPEPEPHVKEYLGLLEGSETALAEGLERIAQGHREEPDIPGQCSLLAGWSREGLEALHPLIERYGDHEEAEPQRLAEALEPRLRKTGFGLVRDLHDCWVMTGETYMSLVVLDQAAKALRDTDMQQLVERVMSQNERQRSWLLTRIKQAAPQALVVPS